jgi:hypothetical protein
MKSVTVTAAAMALLAIGGAGTALADPGNGMGQGRGNDDPVPERHGRGTDDAPRAQAPQGAGAAPCMMGRGPRVGYVFRGTVATTTTDSVTANLWGANAHARRVLANATPPVAISTESATDLLLVPTPTGTTMRRNGVTGAPLVGDQIIVKYRAPHSKKLGARCAARGGLAVTVTGSPAVSLTGAGVQLKWVSAWGPVVT